MTEFAQLNENPVLESSPVANKSAGHDAASKIFGMASQVAFKQAESMQKDQSSAMLMNANAQATSVATDAMIRMKSNPSQHEQILKDTDANFSTIKQTQLSSSDRKKLDYIVNGNVNKLKLSSAEIGIKQNRLQNSLNFYSAYNENMSELGHALSSGDFKRADILQESMLNTAKNSVLDQSLSPQAFMKMQGSIIEMHNRAQRMHDIMGSDDANAQKSHEASYNIFSNDNTDLSEKPSNHGTNIIANHHIEIATEADIAKNIYSGHISPNITENIMNQTPAKFEKSFQMISGSVKAHSQIQSNGSMIDVDKRINDLNNKPNLGSSEDAELNVLNGYKKSFESGDFISTISNTTLGSQAAQQWNEEKAAVQKNISYSLDSEDIAEDKEMALAKVDNKYQQSLAAIANGMHIDPNKMRVILPNIINDITSSFKAGGDPNTALNQISRLDKSLVGYMANQTKDPIQKEVMYTVGLGYHNDMKPEFMNNLIYANQSGNNYTGIKSEDSVSDATLVAQIKSNTSDIMKQLTVSGGSKAVSRMAGFTKSALNYVKFRAIQSGDLDLSDSDKYIKEFTDNMASAYNLSSRSHGSFNNSQIEMSHAQQDSLQRFAIAKARQAFAGTTEDSLETKSGLFKTDFHVYIDETNNVIAKDESGHTFYHTPYSKELLNAAQHYNYPIELSTKDREDLENFMRRRSPMLYGD